MSEAQVSTELPDEDCFQGGQRPSKHRSAFLLGLELAQQQLDDVRSYLFQLCDVLPMSKVMLMDAALVRIELFDCEVASMSGLAQQNTDIGFWAKSYSHARSFLSNREWKYVTEAAGRLVEYSREIQAWYLAGYYGGQLITDCSTLATTGQRIEGFSERFKEFRDLITTAANSRPAASRLNSESELSVRLEQLTQSNASFETLQHGMLALARLIEDPQPDPSRTAQELRNAFIYEQLINGVYGEKASRVIDQECERQGWAKLDDLGQLKRIADGHALEHGLPAVPTRPPGRPPKQNKLKNNRG